MGTLVKINDIKHFRKLWNNSNTKDFFDNRFNNITYINEKINIKKRGLK